MTRFQVPTAAVVLNGRMSSFGLRRDGDVRDFGCLLHSWTPMAGELCLSSSLEQLAVDWSRLTDFRRVIGSVGSCVYDYAWSRIACDLAYIVLTSDWLLGLLYTVMFFFQKDLLISEMQVILYMKSFFFFQWKHMEIP